MQMMIERGGSGSKDGRLAEMLSRHMVKQPETRSTTHPDNRNERKISFVTEFDLWWLKAPKPKLSGRSTTNFPNQNFITIIIYYLMWNVNVEMVDTATYTRTGKKKNRAQLDTLRDW